MSTKKLSLESEVVMLTRNLADADDKIKQLMQELSRQAYVVKNFDEALAITEARVRAAQAGEDRAVKALADQASRINLATQFAQITEGMWKDACLKCACGAYRMDRLGVQP